MPALVSCVIPVHNGRDFLAEAIDSVIAQGWSRMQIIVIDDGSTDGSAEIAARYAGVEVLFQDRAGVAAARNAGLARAEGDYVAFLDADDLWLPGKLAAQMALLAVAPAPAYCLTWVRHQAMDRFRLAPDGDGQAMFAGADGKPVAVTLPDPAPTPGRLMSCLLAPRVVFDRVGPISTATRTRADQDWFLRAAEAGVSELMVPEALVSRRIHGRNHSLAADSRVMDDFLTIAKRALDRRRQDDTLRPAEQWTVRR